MRTTYANPIGVGEIIYSSERWTGRKEWKGSPAQRAYAWINDGELIVKLKLLRTMWNTPKIWYKEVWSQDPYSRMCCNGYMCGCMGADYIMYWEHLLNEAG